MPSTESQILIAGFGNMGRALVRGWLDSGVDPAAIVVADQSERAIEHAKALGLGIYAHEAACVDVLLIAVKPQQVASALKQYGPALRATGVVLSIAAGRTLASLQENMPAGAAVVRAMPNTPAAIAQGTTVVCPNAAVSEAQLNACIRLLEAVGAVFRVDDEAMLDGVTAVSGSGPAYVFLLIECLKAAGVRQGLPEALAADLALHTVVGAGAYALKSETDVATLREQVTSPGGTTAAALDVLMRDDALQNLIAEAVAAAAARSAELSSDEAG